MNVAEVAGDRRRDQRDEERGGKNDDRPHLGVAAPDEAGANGDCKEAEADSGEHTEQDSEHGLGSQNGGATGVNVRLAVVGGCAAGLASGWNISNTGAVAQQLGKAY